MIYCLIKYIVDFLTKAQTIENVDEVVEVAVAAVKRGRGRPRKEKPIKREEATR